MPERHSGDNLGNMSSKPWTQPVATLAEASHEQSNLLFTQPYHHQTCIYTALSLSLCPCELVK